MTQRRQTATGAGGRSRTCVGRPSAVISIRTVNGGLSSGGSVSAHSRRASRSFFSSNRAATLAAYACPSGVASFACAWAYASSKRSAVSGGTAAASARVAKTAIRRADRTRRLGAPGGGAHARVCREGLGAAGDHLLGDGEREPEVTFALLSEHDARHGRDPGLVEQDARGRPRVGRQPGRQFREEVESRPRGLDLEARRLQARNESRRAGSDSPLSTRRRTRCRGRAPPRRPTASAWTRRWSCRGRPSGSAPGIASAG